MTKRAQRKATGRTSLTWSELEEVQLDAKINLNRRPVTYVEDDLQYPILLPPNSMLLEIVTPTSEECPDEDDESNWKRRQRYVTR